MALLLLLLLTQQWLTQRVEVSYAVACPMADCWLCWAAAVAFAQGAAASDTLRCGPRRRWTLRLVCE